MNKNIQRGLIAVGALVSATGALAGGPDMTGLTTAVDFGTVTTAVLAIGGLLAVVYVALKGVSLGLSMLKR